jgi:hypothetical protein
MRVGILRSNNDHRAGARSGQGQALPYFLSQNINQLNFQSTNK